MGHHRYDQDDLDAQFPRAGREVDGRLVREHVPNVASIGASLDHYEILSGIREVSLALFDAPAERTKRTLALAEQIRASGEINPLIVAVDEKGPYILEGGHRYDALKILDAKAFPALVVIEQ